MTELQIGLLIFPRMTQLDMTGPFEVFARIPNAKVHLVWKRVEPVVSDTGLTVHPTTTCADCPQLDVICVPGGPGQIDLMEDREIIDFVRRQGEGARYVTSVCTGALVLGAAGLLNGYRAATHWASMDQSRAFRGRPHQDPRMHQPQPDYRRRRHRRHRFRAGRGRPLHRSPHGGKNPALHGIQPAAAVRSRHAGHRTTRGACRVPGDGTADADAAQGGDAARRRGPAGVRRKPGRASSG